MVTQRDPGLTEGELESGGQKLSQPLSSTLLPGDRFDKRRLLYEQGGKNDRA